MRARTRIAGTRDLWLKGTDKRIGRAEMYNNYHWCEMIAYLDAPANVSDSDSPMG